MDEETAAEDIHEMAQLKRDLKHRKRVQKYLSKRRDLVDKLGRSESRLFRMFSPASHYYAREGGFEPVLANRKFLFRSRNNQQMIYNGDDNAHYVSLSGRPMRWDVEFQSPASWHESLKMVADATLAHGRAQTTAIFGRDGFTRSMKDPNLSRETARY